MRNTQDQLEGMKDENYPSLGGGDKRSEILKVRWKGWKIRDTQGQRERMNDQEYSYLGGSGANWKYSRLVGMDGGLEILKVRWQGCKIGITQGQVECLQRLKIHKVRQMKGMEDQRNTMLDGKNERLGILTFRRKWCKLEILQVGWNGWRIRNTEGQVARMQDR